MSDEQLWARIKKADASALEEIYDRYASLVFSIAIRLVRDTQLAEEVVQDVFTKVWVTDSYHPELGPFDRWISVIARRSAIDGLRKMMRVLDIADSDLVYGDRSTSDSKVPTLDDQLKTMEFHRDLQQVLPKLKNEERLIIEWAYFEGWTLSAIADRLNMPLGTVKTRLHHALRVLRASLSGWEREGEL